LKETIAGINQEYQNTTYTLECILNKVDPQFEANRKNDCRLSILLCQDGFSFLVTHAESRKVLKISSYKLNIISLQHDETGGWPVNGNDYFEMLRKVDLTQLTFKQVDIAVASHKFTIAPHDFVENNGALPVISAAYPISSGEEIITEPVFDLGPVTAMLVPAYIRESCARIFPGSVLRSASAIFVKGILRKYSRLIARQIFINIHPGFFEITVIQGLRLLYLNAFRYSAPSDVLYYVIFVLEQLGFVPSEEKITLMGDIDENSIITSQLKMYCESLGFIEKPGELEYGEAFAEVAMHNHFILLNIPICE
jgi:hypothetical protein